MPVVYLHYPEIINWLNDGLPPQYAAVRQMYILPMFENTYFTSFLDVKERDFSHF